jgi:hypothetical protein
MEQSELNKLSFEDAAKKYNNKEITTEELITIAQKFGKDVKFWDMEKESNPKYQDGNNKSRLGFKWNPFKHPKGIYFQWVIKKTIIKCIYFVHEQTLKMYDMDQFEYEDNRLIRLDAFTKAYIDMYFTDKVDPNATEKRIYMSKLVDIVHGTLSKEDVYYRARYFDYINKMIKEFPDGFPLTKEERENIEKWR